MSRTHRIVGTAAMGLLAVTAIGTPVVGSSHREAPMIAKDPAADITDLYAFVSPDKPDMVTIIANYTGFQEPGGGPNFYSFDPDVQYWIKVDNTGDGRGDITFTFRFQTQTANPGSFLYSGYGPIGPVDSNVTQTVTVRRNSSTIGAGLAVPAPNIGPRTTPHYRDLAADGIHSLSGGNGRFFAGQRDDPFFVDLGAIFDLGGLRQFNQAHLIPLPTAKGQDELAAYNVNSIAIQVPITKLTRDGEAVADKDAANAVIGVWAGANRRSRTVLDGEGDSSTSGDWVQVSRLGNPLINEVIIGLGEKDAWNASNPRDDADYETRYTDPELAAIINTIYPSLPDARTTGRSDLVLILGQGVPGLNQTNATGLYDMLRLNMGIAPAANPKRLGVLKGDFAGFPNGRRLADDVVDIELRAVADGYGPVLESAFGLPNLSPNNQVGDGCDRNDKPFLAHFPYVAQPWQGYSGGAYRSSPC